MKKLTLTIAILMVAITCGCGKAINQLDASLVEVKVVGIWSQEDYDKAGKWSSPYFPHAIVEIVSTGERGRVFGNPIGKTGEVFKVPRYAVRAAGK